MPGLHLDDRSVSIEPAVMDALPELVKFAGTVADALLSESPSLEAWGWPFLCVIISAHWY